MVILDAREPLNIGIEAVLEIPDKEIEIMPLPAGDILLSLVHRTEFQKSKLAEMAREGIVIERKTGEDFLASLSDGRLFDQAVRLVEFCPRSLITILGTFYNKGGKVQVGGRITGWDIWSVRMAIYRLQAAGLPVLQLGDHDLPIIIHHLYSRLGKQDNLVVPKPPSDPLHLANDELTFLCGIPGLGAHRAMAVYDYCGRNLKESLLYLLDPNNIGKDAKRPKDIGPKTIEGVRKFFGLKPGERFVQVVKAQPVDTVTPQERMKKDMNDLFGG